MNKGVIEIFINYTKIMTPKIVSNNFEVIPKMVTFDMCINLKV